MSDEAEMLPRVLRRCPRCRLLFEAAANADRCVVCGVTVDGLALPLAIAAVGAPLTEIEHEPTRPLSVDAEA